MYNSLMANIKRKYFKNVHYTIDTETSTLKLLPEFHAVLLEKKLPFKRGFKKVGGSMLGDFLLTDKYKSQFAAFCNISNIGLPVLDEKYIKAGIAIEPLVINAIRESTNKEVQTFAPEKYNYDYFADKDPILGGVPDGFMPENNTIIEVKTTGEKNLESWKKSNPPINYLKQAAQYAYLMGADKYAIVATFLKDEDYKNPEDFPIKKRIIKNWIFDVNKRDVEDDIQKIKALYKEWTTSGVSPRFDNKIDNDLLLWLNCENEEQWELLKQNWILAKKYIP